MTLATAVAPASVQRVLHNRLVQAAAVALVVTAAVIIPRGLAWLQPLELAAYDRLRVAWAGQEKSERVLLVGIAESDIRRWGYPLPDGDLADLLERVAQAGPRVIGIDLIRDMPVPPGSDKLAAILARHPGILWVFKLAGADDPEIPPPQALRGTERAVLADIPADPGNMIRRGLLYADDGGRNHRSLGLALAEGFLSRDGIPVRIDGDNRLRLGERLIPLLDDTRGPYVEFDTGGYQLLLDFRGGAEPFARLTMAEIMDAGDPAALGQRVRGRAVVVGNIAASVPDAFATPLDTGQDRSALMRGVAIHAHLADQLIRLSLGLSVPLRGWPRTAEVLWICAWAAAGAGLGLTLPSLRWSVLGLAGGLLLLVAIVYAAFGAGFLVPGPPAGIAWIAAAALTHCVSYTASQREREQLREMFEHYLDPALVRGMLKAEEMPHLGGERRHISALFTDLADFTRLSEAMDPVTLGDLVNDYFRGVCTAIDRQRGTVISFSGDGMLAVFGAPQDLPDHVDHAVDAALAVDAFAGKFTALQRDRGVPFGTTRIGVHCGMAMVGNIGSDSGFRYSAVGDVLNTGSRLEGLNKLIGTHVCVSGDVARTAQRHAYRAVGSFVVRGRQEPIEVFEPVDIRFYSRDHLARYDAAFAAMRDGRLDAVVQFAALHNEDPSDPLVAFHRRRLEAGEAGALIGVPDR